MPLQRGRLFCLTGSQVVPLFPLSLFQLGSQTKIIVVSSTSSNYNHNLLTSKYPITHVLFGPTIFISTNACSIKRMRINYIGPYILLAVGQKWDAVSVDEIFFLLNIVLRNFTFFSKQLMRGHGLSSLALGMLKRTFFFVGKFMLKRIE